NMTISGDIYSDGDVTVGTNSSVCGSILSAGGSITLGSNGQITKENATYGGSRKSGRVGSGGSSGITGNIGVLIEGDAIAGAPSTTSCSATSSNYGISIFGGTGTFSVDGAAKACGKISGITGQTSTTQGVTTTAPVPVTF